jgi:hypothetical protein
MCDARYRLRAPHRARLQGVLRAGITRWRSIWETPSNLGVRMAAVGLVALAFALILNRLVPGPFFRDDPQIILVCGYAALHWAIWLTGSALVCVGVFHIVAIDITRY